MSRDRPQFVEEESEWQEDLDESECEFQIWHHGVDLILELHWWIWTRQFCCTVTLSWRIEAQKIDLGLLYLFIQKEQVGKYLAFRIAVRCKGSVKMGIQGNPWLHGDLWIMIANALAYTDGKNILWAYPIWYAIPPQSPCEAVIPNSSLLYWICQVLSAPLLRQFLPYHFHLSSRGQFRRSFQLKIKLRDMESFLPLSRTLPSIDSTLELK